MAEDEKGLTPLDPNDFRTRGRMWDPKGLEKHVTEIIQHLAQVGWTPDRLNEQLATIGFVITPVEKK